MPMRFSVEQLREAARLVHSVMPPTPQYAWPLLAARCGCEVWVKTGHLRDVAVMAPS